MSEQQSITEVLKRFEAGDAAAANELMSLVYGELRRIAAAKLAGERGEFSIQATALVHEAWIRMIDVDYNQTWSSRRHFFAAAAEAMRRILVDRARRRKRRRHGGDRLRVTIEVEELAMPELDGRLEALDRAMARFEEVDAEAAAFVKLRYFTGLSHAETARVLELAPRTADRLWAYGKAWLMREIQQEEVERID